MQSKRFIDVIKQVNQLMLDEGLTAGDKLPSERELALRLNVGRSSVREALRGLELLDLIETRRGEGTFFKETGSHRLVDLLLMYMLRNDKAKEDLAQMRLLIELDAVKLAINNQNADVIAKLEAISTSGKQQKAYCIEQDYLFHRTMVEASNNILMTNMWVSLVDFHKAVQSTQKLVVDHNTSLEEHDKMIQYFKNNDEKSLLALLENHLKKEPF